jgi:hypothetical protein
MNESISRQNEFGDNLYAEFLVAIAFPLRTVNSNRAPFNFVAAQLDRVNELHEMVSNRSVSGGHEDWFNDRCGAVT